MKTVTMRSECRDNIRGIDILCLNLFFKINQLISYRVFLPKGLSFSSLIILVSLYRILAMFFHVRVYDGVQN